MSKSIQLGNSNFGKLITNNGLFADKSLFIQEIIEDTSETLLITRPRRWGKTLNLSMLQHFLSSEVYGQKTAGLFDELKIAQIDNGNFIKQHQGNYPVIFISFKDVKENNFQSALAKFTALIKEMCRGLRYLSDSPLLANDEKSAFLKLLEQPLTQADIENALRHISEWLHKHHNQKVYILID